MPLYGKILEEGGLQWLLKGQSLKPLLQSVVKFVSSRTALEQSGENEKVHIWITFKALGLIFYFVLQIHSKLTLT